jgi:hypothetical protein
MGTVYVDSIDHFATAQNFNAAEFGVERFS